MTRINSLYGSQTSPVVLSMQNNVINIRITSVYGSQPSSVDFACKTATFGPELQVSIDSSPHLRFLHAKQRLLDQNYKSLWVPALICGFCMQNSDFSIRITSLYGSQTPPMIFCIQNSDFSNRIASLYWSQTSSEVFACKTATFGSKFQVSMVPSHHLWFCAKNSDFIIRITSLYGSQPSFVAFACKTATLGPEIQISMGPRPHQCFLHSKERL